MHVKEIFSHPWVRKFNKSPDDSLNSSVTDKLFDLVVDRIQKKKKNNTSKFKNQKIVLKVEKEPVSRISAIKEVEYESHSMMKEIQEIGKQIEDHTERVERINKKTNRLREKLEKSSTMDFTTKFDYDHVELFNSRDEVFHKKKNKNKKSFDIHIAERDIFNKSECSTQTEQGENSTLVNKSSGSAWSNFINMFRCSN
jgi:hypothetical protein